LRKQWFAESEMCNGGAATASRSAASLDKYVIPFFGDKEVGPHHQGRRSCVSRQHSPKLPARKSENTLSNRRVNAVMKPLRQILNEAADRYEFNSPFRNIKPLRIKRSEVMPFTLEEVQIDPWRGSRP
jgi:integrase